MNVKEELLKNIRSMDESLRKIRIREIVIDKKRRSAEFNFICDKTVGDELKDKILSAVNECVPDSFRGVEVNVGKVVADEELVVSAVREYLGRAQSSVLPYVSKEDVSAAVGEDTVKYILNLTPHIASYFAQNAVLEKLNRYLERNFCNIFSGEILNDKQDQSEPLELGNTIAFAPEKIQIRSIFIKNVTPIDDKQMPSFAAYMADIKEPAQSVVLSGTVTSIRERETKNGKPFFLIDFTDKTGSVTGRYFSKKATLEKVRALKEGDGIITEGDMDFFNNGLSYTIKKINACEFPADFVPEKPRKREPEPEYKLVKPEKLVSVKQYGLFETEPEPEACLMGKSFVVFDLETTGTVASSDMITEIGAVKIEDGKITDKFQTLINPGRGISQFITELTGINDDMVKDAPFFKDVLPDFYKFTYGCILVAHNIDFDYKFIKYHAKGEGYNFYNPGIDTLSLARELLPQLPNHKLNTVAGHFDIQFNHHRALSDAVATAEMFLKLINIKKCLPKY